MKNSLLPPVLGIVLPPYVFSEKAKKAMQKIANQKYFRKTYGYGC